MTTLRDHVRDIQARAPTLARMTVVSLGILAVASVGLLLDDRQLGGAPVWLKPAKFGLSSAVFLAALAWMVRDMPASRLTRFASATIAWLMVAEILLVTLQAARGRQSHFNVDTPMDGTIFSTMGLGIAIVWMLSAVLLVQHLRAPAVDRSLAMAFRIGLALHIVGAGVGWVMVQPQPGQVAAIERQERPFRVGAHTVGAPDGGESLPVTGWSRTHGDLRIPHFIGLHALQLLPLFVLAIRALRRRRDDAAERSALTLAAGASVALFATALLQALAGHPLAPLT
ncbi:MAG: hypothetical protein V4813_19135 [Gemmatimonadota bacterium]